MTTATDMPPEHRRQAVQERRRYIIGFGMALLLSLPGFLLLAFPVLPRNAALWATGIAALLQMVVHFRYFLHIRFRGQTREDLHLVLFTVLILLLMVGGSIFVLFDLGDRM